MKKSISLIILLLLSIVNFAQKVDLNYYLPENTSLNPEIPTPEDFLGFQVGEWHVSHDQLVSYMKLLAEKSDRAVIQEYGRSYENRPLLHLIFTSPKNQNDLDELKKAHQDLCDPSKSSKTDISSMPVIVLLGYSVHGNEASGANASLLSAYYLAAAEGAEIERVLENSTILIDPCLNPDGLTRFTTWANMHKSQQLSPDPNNRAFSEPWPGGRTNHYWFDLNRDYLLLANPESIGRVQKLQEWRPNVVTDHHEMGSNSSFFFQPGVQSRNNPLTPEKNYTLTKKIAFYHSEALNKIGSLYYSEESFDDYYFGKGSSYPDINGGIGILFEQASVRGFEKETVNGKLTFPFAIRNHFRVSLSTINASFALKNELLNYQKEFFTSAIKEASKSNVKAYVFGDKYDYGKTYEFIKLLQGHNIQVYKYSTENSYAVPMEQENYRLIRSFFEPADKFKDSTFYDVSTWNLPMSFNMPYVSISNKNNIGDIINKIELQPGIIISEDIPYAYVFKWDEYYAPRALFKLLKAGLTIKVSTSEFTYNEKDLKEEFGYGTILIPVNNQKLSHDKILKLLKKCTAENGIDIYGLKTGWNSEGIDLGSPKFIALNYPEVLMLVGNRVSSRDAGEIWHLFDTRYKLPITMSEVARVGRIKLTNYSTIILPGGSYSELDEAAIIKLKNWVKSGGNLIAYKSANQWLSSNKFIAIKFKKGAKPDTSIQINYVNKSKEYGKQLVSGAIFEVNLDLTHPLAYGYHNSKIPVFKTTANVVEFPESTDYKWFNYSTNPLLSGYASDENIKQIAKTPFLLVKTMGAGKIISIFDNTNFRGVWYGTNKIFCNAVVFGPIINSGRSRY